MWFKSDASVDVFKGYTETACNCFNACRYSIAKMTAETDANSSSKFMVDFLGEGDDLNMWMHLHEERKDLLNEVANFADGTLGKMEIVKERLKNKKQYKTLKDCYGGFCSGDAAKTAKILEDKGLELRQKVLYFYEKVQKERGMTIEQEKFKRMMAGVLLVTGACCGMALLAANPGVVVADSMIVRIGAATLLDRFFDSSTLMIEKSLAALPKNGDTAQFTKDEIKRATTFLQDMQTKPINDTIHESIQGVYSSSTELSSSARTQCTNLINDIIKESQKLIDTCHSSQSYLPITDGDDDSDNQKIKKSIGFLYTVAQSFQGKKKVKN
jgi:hypothetical protein